MNILIADDHFAVREGLKAVLRADGQGRFEVVAEAASLAETRQALAERPIDLILLDIQFGDGNGLDLVAELQASGAHPLVLVLSMFQEGTFVFRALQAGARGFVSKASVGTVLVEAIDALARGHVYLDACCMDSLAGVVRNLPADLSELGGPLANLSLREREILLKLVHGDNTKSIALELGISTKTVENHRSTLFGKLGINGTVELMQFARSHHLF